MKSYHFLDFWDVRPKDLEMNFSNHLWEEELYTILDFVKSALQMEEV